MIFFKNYFFINLVVVFLAVLSSYILEFIFQLTPCRICLYQRYLWLILFLLLLISQKFFKKFVLLKISLISINITFLLLLGLYHSGIELGLFNNVISCSSERGLKANTIEELDQIIRTSENNDCSFVRNRYLGLSLANISFLISFILLIFNLIQFRIELSNYNAKKNKRNH